MTWVVIRYNITCRIIMVLEAICAGSCMSVYIGKFVKLSVVGSPDLLGYYCT